MEDYQNQLLEARSLALLHVVSVCENGWEEGSRTLQSDGTSKHGKKFVTFNVIGDNGETSVVGSREVDGGDADTQLQALKEIVTDVCERKESGSR